MNSTSESLLIRLQQHAEGSSHAIDQSAWDTFVGLYTPLLFFWARKVGLKQADAADLVQEVLTIVFRRLPNLKYDRQGSFRGWLRTVTLNKFRENRRRKSLPISDVSQSQFGDLIPVPQAESTWDMDYGRVLLEQAMNQMKCDFEPATWKALMAVMQNNLTIDQAAQTFDISRWTIYSARSRLMQRLREQLDGLL